MNNIKQLDDQLLSAFVDDELDEEMSAFIIHEMDNSFEIRERIYKLRRIKDLVRLCFRHNLASSNFNIRRRKALRWPNIIGAITFITALIIILTTGASWYFISK